MSFRNIRSFLLTTLLLLLLSKVNSAPCFGKLNYTFTFEEVCFKTIFYGTTGFALREYSGTALGSTLVTYNASASITTYQEALMLTTFYVFEYFTGGGNALNKSLINARTVPLLLRPPTPQNNEWLATMALSPSKYPSKSNPPVPIPGPSGVILKTISDGSAPIQIAVQRADLTQDPQPSDFDTLCSQLQANVKVQLPNWKIDETSEYTYSHARYYTEIFFGSYWTCECWARVSKV